MSQLQHKINDLLTYRCHTHSIFHLKKISSSLWFISKPGLHYEPKMTDLMNEIAVKLPDKWQDIGRGLGLEEYELKQIQGEHGWQQSINVFFSCVLYKWRVGE